MKLETRDQRRLGELQADLEVVRVSGRPFLADAIAAMKEVIGSDSMVAYGLRQGAEATHEVVGLTNAGLAEPRFSSFFPDYVARQAVRWAAYNSSRPEPKQRNRVRVWEARELTVDRAPAHADLYPQIGIAGLDQMRALVCEGPSLLAWVGGWQPARFTHRQRALFASIVPHLQRRLAVERQIAQGGRWPVLAAALEAIGRPAFVVAANGRILETNSAGRALLERDARTLREELMRAIATRAEDPKWTVTRVQSAGSGIERLVVGRASPSERGPAQVARAALRWTLSPRQKEVLAKVVEGNSNQTIAAMLGISERTVEVHMTALFVRAQVERRAELVAAVLSADWE